MEFTFKYYEKEYILNNDNLEYFENDEVNPLDDINEEKVIEILNNAENVEFSKAYFDLPCSKCKAGVEEKKKFFDFLELNFYIYAKDGKFVISTLDKKCQKGERRQKLHQNQNNIGNDKNHSEYKSFEGENL